MFVYDMFLFVILTAIANLLAYGLYLLGYKIYVRICEINYLIDSLFRIVNKIEHIENSLEDLIISNKSTKNNISQINILSWFQAIVSYIGTIYGIYSSNKLSNMEHHINDIAINQMNLYGIYSSNKLSNMEDHINDIAINQMNQNFNKELYAPKSNDNSNQFDTYKSILKCFFEIIKDYLAKKITENIFSNNYSPYPPNVTMPSRPIPSTTVIRSIPPVTLNTSTTPDQIISIPTTPVPTTPQPPNVQSFFSKNLDLNSNNQNQSSDDVQIIFDLTELVNDSQNPNKSANNDQSNNDQSNNDQSTNDQSTNNDHSTENNGQMLKISELLNKFRSKISENPNFVNTIIEKSQVETAPEMRELHNMTFTDNLTDNFDRQ